MTKTKSRILAALALTTALTAPALIAPMFTAPAAIAGRAVPVQDFSDLAAKVTPAVVNVAVTMKAGAADDDETRMSDRSQQTQMEEFMSASPSASASRGSRAPRASARSPREGPGASAPASSSTPSGMIVTNFHVVGKADSITVTMSDGRKLPAKLLGGDEKTDLAVLKVESDKPLPFVDVRRRHARCASARPSWRSATRSASAAP